MKTTTNKILTFLENHNPATVEQIAQAVDLTKADVRYQLRQLEAIGRINRMPPVASTSPGRPAGLFSIKPQVPENFYRLVIEVLLDNRGLSGDSAQAIVRALLGSAGYSGSPGARLGQKAHRLAQFGIHIRWEAGRKGPLVRIEQEPITSVIQDTALAHRILQLLLADLQEKSPG